MASFKLPYEIHLSSPGEPMIEGRPLATVPPLAGRLDATGLAKVGLRLDDSLSPAELRWAVDKGLRPLRALLGLGSVNIHATASVPDDTVLTLALDQHHASGGAVTVADRPAVTAALARLGSAEDGYRAWVDEDPTVRTSLAIAADVQAWADGQPTVSVEVLDEAALAEKGLNLLLAVGGASTISPPRLVIARHAPSGAGKHDGPPLVLLGKGITFDSGGINVKPYESFVSTMKNDMAGAALAWHLFRALVEAGCDTPMAVVLPTCENPIGEQAMRPGSIVTGHAGKAVRIDHTDAEGRLVLADALSYATDILVPAGDQLCHANDRRPQLLWAVRYAGALRRGALPVGAGGRVGVVGRGPPLLRAPGLALRGQPGRRSRPSKHGAPSEPRPSRGRFSERRPLPAPLRDRSTGPLRHLRFDVELGGRCPGFRLRRYGCTAADGSARRRGRYRSRRALTASARRSSTGSVDAQSRHASVML